MIQVNRIYLIFNRLVTKKFLVDTSGCILVYNNEKKKATEILNKYEETEEIAPWNVGYRDYNFKLIRKLSRILKK